MHHPTVVRVGQRPGYFLEQPRRRVIGQRPPLTYAPPERVPVHVRHREVHEVRDLVHGEDRDDTGVRELSGGAGFAQEALPCGRLEGLLGRQQLDRDPAVEPQLASEVYDPHPAAPQASFQHVAPREGALEIREKRVGCRGHGACVPRGAYARFRSECAVRSQA